MGGMANGAKAGAVLGSAAQERFGGRFYLHELINRGGVADIWLVTDERGKTFALRKLKPKLRFNFRAQRFIALKIKELHGMGCYG